MVVMKLVAKAPHPEFLLWLEQVKAIGCSYEVVIENGEISRVYVRESDDGNWGTIEFGRVHGTKSLSFKERVFMPRLIGDKFIPDYNGK